MKISKSFWIGILCAIGGCSQILELDQEYRPAPNASGGAGGSGATGGSAGAGGNLGCVVDMDCPAPSAPCTGVKCVANTCVNNMLPAGASCTPDGSLVCNAAGICGECNQASDCTQLPADDECQTRVCTNHICGQTFAAAGTKLVNQTAGDCVDAFCDGSGKTTTTANSMDLPEDNNPCTKNTCNGGTPAFPFEPVNTTCGANLKCNDMGQCVGCLMATDCAGMDDFCKTRTCTNGMCGFNFTAMGTDLPTGQTVGDCKVRECDGQGNIAASPNNMDVPVDGNPCTKDVCTGGVPSNPLEATNTPCGTGGLCNPMGLCQKGNGTTCANDTECASAHCVEGYCCDSTCNQNCKACNVPGMLGMCSIVPAGYADDSCPSPKSCDGSTGNNACIAKFPMGYACTQATQCGSGMCVDGVCCSSACATACKSCNVAGSAGTCANLPANQEDGALCSGANSCDGAGACKKDNGQTCGAGTECASGMCVDGVCCNSACATTCKACNVAGSVGTCSNVLAGVEDAPGCTGTNSCNGMGTCKKDNGQTCAAIGDCASNFCIDGVCCDSACLGTCQACNVMGTPGTCVNVPLGQEDIVATTACMGVNSCNGAGACLLDNGQSCTMNSECASNNCTAMMCQ